ncbi:phosphatidate cytidylyltransferase [Thalassospira sp.]|uniref:phosphatidate cytidylyltransferase n=1 Tax=Thalassospira sp. TaxID=1912094 RepID=UPI0032EACE8C
MQSSEAERQKDNNSGLMPRVLSALVMTPVAIAAVWFGSPYFDILLFLFSAGMMWEWSRMCAAGHYNGVSVVAAVALGVAMLMQVTGQEEYIVMPIAISVIIAAARSGRNWLLAGFGVLYVSLAALTALWLRNQDGDGLLIIMWLFFLVWATDTGGYAFGKAIGGPKLAPRFSPKKTWAGLVGGMACAGLIGGLVTYFSADAINWTIVVVSMALAIVAQIGDLGESALKRHFKVKDSSNLIPGHGGLLDRADGMLSVFPIAFVMICFAGLALR